VEDLKHASNNGQRQDAETTSLASGVVHDVSDRLASTRGNFLGSRQLFRGVAAQQTSVTKAPTELVSAKQAATRLAVLPFESFGQEQENDFSEKVLTEFTTTRELANSYDALLLLLGQHPS